MLEKAKRINDVTVYRRGCGHFLGLLKALKDYGELSVLNSYLLGESENVPIVCREVLIMALRKFTNIRNPKRYVRKYLVKAMQIMIEVIKYNSLPDKQKESGKEYGIDDLSVDILEVIARGGYASNPDYVYDQIDLPTVYQLKRRVDQRENQNFRMELLIQHDPKGAMEQLNAADNIKVMTWNDLLQGKRHG